MGPVRAVRHNEGMTDPSPAQSAERPDARLVHLHAERGDPHARLAGALAALEGADWGVLLSGEAALARQLSALLGTGTLRVDARVRVNREALADAGLAVAGLDADWRGARAVWLLEPDADTLERAARAGVRVIVDATLAPGGLWFPSGVEFTVYRDSVTLSGHGDAPLAAVFGLGRQPDVGGTSPRDLTPSDLSVALCLRDVATLPLRLARAARTTTQVLDRLGGAAQPAGPTAVLLAPDAVADTSAPLGGVRAAARSVPGGVLLTPGLEDATVALALLGGASAPAQPRPVPEAAARAREEAPAPAARPQDRREEGRAEGGRRDERSGSEFRPQERRGKFRRDDFRSGDRAEARRGDRPDRHSRPDRPGPDQGRAAPSLERFTFEAPATGAAPDVDAEPLFPAGGAPTAPTVPLVDTTQGTDGEVWEPEIVFSDFPAPEVTPDLSPVPVNPGPDGPEEVVVPPLTVLAPAVEDDAPAPADLAEPEAPVTLAPDLPGGKEDPAANLTDEQAAVYARLREWRNAEAKRQEISRFIIASNATLAEIARRVPYTLEDLRAVKGMGTGRLGKYGEKILEVVRG